MSNQRITLDDPAFAGRLKYNRRRSFYERRNPVVVSRQNQISDFLALNSSPNRVQYHNTSLGSKQTQPPTGEPAAGIVAKDKNRAEARAVLKSSKRTTILLAVMAVMLFAGGIITASIQLQTNRHVAAQVVGANSPSENIIARGDGGTALPSEAKPSKSASYTVPLLQPKLLTIPKLDISARVRKLGVDSHNELQVPNNIYDTGWYEESAKPGDAGGAILIDGHVSGATKQGIFYSLKTLGIGDGIEVERGDGTKYRFKVVKLQYYDVDKVDMIAAITSAVPGKPGLNLITCAGQYNTSAGRYDQRLIVFAVAT